MKIQSKVFNKQDGTTTLSHTMQTLECNQLPSSTSPNNEILPSSLVDTANILEISASPKPETKSLPSSTKEHPRSDIHRSTSSRCRALKAKKDTVTCYSTLIRFSLLVYDDSGKIEVTVFGDEGEKIMQMSANDFLDKYRNIPQMSLKSLHHQNQKQNRFHHQQKSILAPTYTAAHPPAVER
ncbi:hypothetical protein OROHE_019796 [Orobanche hederae]